MSSLSRDLIFLILQFLDDEKFKEAVHKLEQESGFYFNMQHLEDLVQAGEWDEVEKYLGGFTKISDNSISMKIFFEIRKQKYLEALDRHDRAKAVDILVKDLKIFASFNEELFKEITMLLSLENFRQNEKLSMYGDMKSARTSMLMEVKKLIKNNPVFRDKLTFPTFQASRLRTLINQSLNWQHQLCKNPSANPEIQTLFTNHSCAAPTNGPRVLPTNSQLVGSVPQTRTFPPNDIHSPFQSVSSPPASSVVGWMTNANPSSPYAVVAPGPSGLVPPQNAAFVNHPRLPTGALGIDHHIADSERPMKKTRISEVDEASPSGTTHQHNIYVQDDIPKTVVQTLNQGSNVMSMDSYYVCHRLFSCGTSKDGDSHLVEWNESNGSINRTYSGFRKPSLGVVQLDTTRNRFLAAGDDFQIKFWDMDNTNILTTTDADGGLPAIPDGQRVLKMFEASRSASQQSNFNVKAADVKPRIPEETEKIRSSKPAEIVNVGHLKALRLPDSTSAVSRVVRLLYTNSGLALLALGSDAVHKLWKWPLDERNPSKSTASVAPQLWLPSSGILMINETSDNNPEEGTACIGLSKNDSYVTSASGGKVSLFNMVNFKVLTTFIPTSSAATSLAFHPEDNNTIAVGMEDSSILIYNARINEVKTKLKGHQKKITGLAFSPSLNVLVSAGADAQLCVWSFDGWEKKRSHFIQVSAGCASPLVGDIQIQFHNDQAHLLAVHKSQIAIYDSKLDSLCSWSPKDELPASVSSATFSCDGLSVYAAFVDGAVGVFEANNLRLRCQIAPSAYISGSSGYAYPMVIAAHPSEPNQIALGMSDGAVHVIEPLDGDTKWSSAAPSQDNGPPPTTSSTPTQNNCQASQPRLR